MSVNNDYGVNNSSSTITSKKIQYVSSGVFERWLKAKESGSKAPITGDRKSTVLPQFAGFTFKIHNGKVWLNLFVYETMIGHKFGEFVATRIFRKHGGSKVTIAKGAKKKK